eukprot:652497-Rhodomonas_salina.1
MMQRQLGLGQPEPPRESARTGRRGGGAPALPAQGSDASARAAAPGQASERETKVRNRTLAGGSEQAARSDATFL